MVSQQLNPTPEIVVLVHGLAAKRLVMTVLRASLAKSYGEVVNWGYPSLWSPIERHGRELARLLRRLDDGRCERIHLVTHSMGGIVARVALAEYQPGRLGRFVMIAPPNRGSYVATRFAPLLGQICPPIRQLADHEASFVRSLPLPSCELGVIAAGTDWMVPEASTHLGCQRDHIVVPGLHSTVLWRRETAAQVRHFLEHGAFCRGAGVSPAV
jgi:pimeloyl-ACP methyl ester carboxylesterase